MSNSPPTFGTDPERHADAGWTDLSTLHKKNDGGGLLYQLKAVRQGTLAELIRFVLLLPESERKTYVIEKPGDHRLDYAEIVELSGRPDFPA